MRHLLQALHGQPASRAETHRRSLPDKFNGAADHCKGFLRPIVLHQHFHTWRGKSRTAPPEPVKLGRAQVTQEDQF